MSSSTVALACGSPEPGFTQVLQAPWPTGNASVVSYTVTAGAGTSWSYSGSMLATI